MSVVQSNHFSYIRQFHSCSTFDDRLHYLCNHFLTQKRLVKHDAISTYEAFINSGGQQSIH